MPLINAYCTHRDPPALAFPHKLRNRSDAANPELANHLNGLCGYVFGRGKDEMTQLKLHLIQHIQRVKHQFSMEVEDTEFDALADWAWEANAVLFLPDGSMRSPNGALLLDRDGRMDAEAVLPFPEDALERKERNEAHIKRLGAQVAHSLPPVVGEVELKLRTSDEVLGRAQALAAVAIRAESLSNSPPPILVKDLKRLLPLGFPALSPNEAEFLDAEQPDPQEVTNFVWRYESLQALVWALSLQPELQFPKEMCDVEALLQLFKQPKAKLKKDAKLRPAAEILDAVDLHYRLHWLVRESQLQDQEPPLDLEGSVVYERHYALNWLTRYEEAAWDDVDTAT